MANVRWREVPGFEGLYQVSSGGSVRSVRSGTILRCCNSIRLTRKDGTFLNTTVARLVLQAFRGAPPSPEHVAARLDRMRGNNALRNLAWKTRREFPPTCKLTHADARNIRKLARQGRRSSEIAQMYGITRQNVHGIVTKRNWAA